MGLGQRFCTNDTFPPSRSGSSRCADITGEEAADNYTLSEQRQAVVSGGIAVALACSPLVGELLFGRDGPLRSFGVGGRGIRAGKDGADPAPFSQTANRLRCRIRTLQIRTQSSSTVMSVANFTSVCTVDVFFFSVPVII